jgi:protein-tyrosine phosphatase
MAAVIARGLLQERGWTHVDVRSAGTGAAPGSAASAEAIVVSREHQLDLSEHAAQPLTPELVAWADLVLAMGASHVHAITALGGAGKVALVTDFLPGDDAGAAVADPFGGDEDSYRETFGQLREAVSALLARLEPILAP